MKYLATMVVTTRYILEVSAKDEDVAREKLEAAFEKLTIPHMEPSKWGKFEIEEEIDSEIEEA